MCRAVIISAINLLVSAMAQTSMAQDDTAFVTQAELEPGFGFVWTNGGTQDIPEPKWRLFGHAVSPDGVFLAYVDGETSKSEAVLRIKNLETSETWNVADYGYGPQFSPDGTMLYFKSVERGLRFYDLASRTTRVIDRKIDSGFGILTPVWAPDWNLYFVNVHQRPDGISLWRIQWDSTQISDRFILNPVGRGGLPHFNCCDTSWYVTYLRTNTPLLNSGFDLVRSFDWDARTPVIVRTMSDTWSFSATNTWSPGVSGLDYAVTQEGVVYFYLSLRSNDEERHGFTPPFSQEELRARDASGWYRIDTSGHQLVQMVRSWTPSLGVSVTADGEKIFYGMLMPDSTCAVWQMDRFGRSKRQVTVPALTSDIDVLNRDIDTHAPLRVSVAIDSDVLRIAIPSNMREVRCAVFDGIGRRIETPKSNGAIDGKLTLDVSTLTSGTYHVVVRSANGQACSAPVVIVR